jgi:hypothetical protein
MHNELQNLLAARERLQKIQDAARSSMGFQLLDTRGLSRQIGALTVKIYAARKALGQTIIRPDAQAFEAIERPDVSATEDR